MKKIQKKQKLEQKQNEKRGMKTDKAKEAGSNGEIVCITYIFVLLFGAMMLNFVYFIVHDSETVIQNAYNQKRQEILEKQVSRGEVYTADEVLLAKSGAGEVGKNMERQYVYDNMFCHVLGRTLKGATGLEEAYGFKLLQSSINPLMQLKSEISGEKKPGDSLTTTLQFDIQKAAYDAMGSHKGAVVVMEPSTGKILAMVSKPDYDPNRVKNDQYWQSLLDQKDEDSALLNRATNGVYAPGSTFKILTTLAYLRQEDDVSGYSYTCQGSDYFCGSRVKCYAGEVHGTEDLQQSFAHSCNTSFANIGTELKLGKFRNLCEKFLFNQDLPVSFGYTKSSFVLDKNDDAAHVAETAIGQGKTTISPLHNAMIVSTVANDGVMMKPYLEWKIQDGYGHVVEERQPEEYGRIISKKQAKVVQKYMRSVVTEGTASGLAYQSYTSAGKTGSAEYDEKGNSHAWFVGYAPAENPEIAVSVILEGAGTGGEYAVPVARSIFDAYFNTTGE